MKKLDSILGRFEETVMSVFLALATLISFLQVVLRYGFSFSITWAAEASTFLLIWAALIGASYGIRKKVHIAVDTFINLLPDRFYRYSMLLSIFISLFYTVSLCWFGTLFVRFLIDIGQLSPDLEWPLWTIFIVVPLSNAMMTFRFFQQFIAEIQKPSSKRARAESGDMPPLLRKVLEEKGEIR